MKINGVEQVNIGTEEEPYWIPKENPFPIKKMRERKKEIVKEWADDILNSEEGEKLKGELDKEFLEYAIYGKTPYYGNKETVKDLKEYCVNNLELTVSDIIDRFGGVLTEEQLKQLKDED